MENRYKSQKTIDEGFVLVFLTRILKRLRANRTGLTLLAQDFLSNGKCGSEPCATLLAQVFPALAKA